MAVVFPPQRGKAPAVPQMPLQRRKAPAVPQMPRQRRSATGRRYMRNPTTRHLEDILNSIGSKEELKACLGDPGFISPCSSFREFYFALPEVQALKLTDLYKLADLDRTYFYHVRSGITKPGRDRIFRLCLAAGLSGPDTRRALEAGSEAPLYVRSRRDAVISFAISKKLTVMQTNELLDEMGLEALE